LLTTDETTKATARQVLIPFLMFLSVVQQKVQSCGLGGSYQFAVAACPIRVR